MITFWFSPRLIMSTGCRVLARDWEVNGRPGDLETLKSAYDEILAHHTYVTGGYGPGENIFTDRDDYLGLMLMCPWDLGGEDPTFLNFAGERVARSDAWGSCEVSCCTWAVFKLCDYLLRFTGEAKYAVWAERMLVNCVGGQPDINPNGGLLYYSNYFADGGMKSTVDMICSRKEQKFPANTVRTRHQLSSRCGRVFQHGVLLQQ
ncbi:MAG: beta-L-arabinofuranosidase domain-containing protein [Bifidobacterium pullorum]